MTFHDITTIGAEVFWAVILTGVICRVAIHTLNDIRVAWREYSTKAKGVSQ